MATEESSQDVPGSFFWTRLDLDKRPTYGPVLRTDAGVLASSSWRKVVKPERRPKPAGWLFPQPYAFEQEIVSPCKGVATTRFNDYFDRYEGAVKVALDGVGSNLYPRGNSLLAARFPTLGYQSLSESKALNALLTHGKELDSNFQIGVAWRERQETALLLTSASQKMVDMAREFRNWRPKIAVSKIPGGVSRSDWLRLKATAYYKEYASRLTNPKKVRRAAKAVFAAPALVAGAILAVQNGWKPLLGDVHAAAEALANRDSPADWLITAKGYTKDEEVIFEDCKVRGLDATPYSAESLLKRACYVRLDATIADQWTHTLAQLGLSNPASLVYESSMLTYVADYFVGLGDWLQALGASAGMKFYSGSVTRFAECVTVVRCSAGSENSFAGSRKWAKMDRKVYDNFPFPISPFELKPGSLNTLSKARIANLASLFYLFVADKPIRNLVA